MDWSKLVYGVPVCHFCILAIGQTLADIAEQVSDFNSHEFGRKGGQGILGVTELSCPSMAIMSLQVQEANRRLDQSMVKQAPGIPFGQPKFFQGFVTLPVLCSIELAYRLPKTWPVDRTLPAKKEAVPLGAAILSNQGPVSAFPPWQHTWAGRQSTQNLLASSLMYQSVLS